MLIVFHHRCMGIICAREATADARFLLVENYTTDYSSWTSVRLGIFGNHTQSPFHHHRRLERRSGEEIKGTVVCEVSGRAGEQGTEDESYEVFKSRMDEIYMSGCKHVAVARTRRFDRNDESWRSSQVDWIDAYESFHELIDEQIAIPSYQAVA